jgi:cell division protease FtsH
LPTDEKHNYSRDFLADQIAILLGGRLAEEICLGNITTGAGNDIERASDLARKMVCEWGMSDVMGPLAFGKKEEQIFLGREIAQHQDYSEDTAVMIDKEVRALVQAAHDKAKAILLERKDALLKMADELLTREVLDGDQVRRIVAGEPAGGSVLAESPSSTVSVGESPAEPASAGLVPPAVPASLPQGQ